MAEIDETAAPGTPADIEGPDLSDLPDVIDAGTVTLVLPDPDDARAFATAVTVSRDELVPWMPWAATDETYDVEFQRARLATAREDADAGRERLFSIVDGDGELVGCMGVHPRRGPHAVDIGYWLRSDRTGRGHARTAARSLTAATLAVPGVDRVEIRCDAANHASAGVARGAGFRLERTVSRPPAAPAETGVEMIWVTP